MARGGQLHSNGDVRTVQLAEVESEFFAVLDRAPLLGRIFVAQDYEESAEPVVIVSHALWESQLGASPETVGRTLRLHGRDHTVVGVMPAEIEWPPGIELWVPRRSPP